MTDQTLLALAELSPLQREAINRAPVGEWFAASEILGPRPANTRSVLADKGVFDRRSDPKTWGRSQYRLARALRTDKDGA